MRTFKPILLLTLFLWSSFASAGFHLDGVACIGKNDEIAPSPKTYQDSDGNTHYTDAFKAWKYAEGIKWEIRQNYSCCEKLTLNESSRICEDRSVIDDSIQTCSAPNAHAECASKPGMGCYPLSEDDMFTTDSEVEAEINAMAYKEKKFEEQQNTVLAGGDPKEVGERCFVNAQCETYSCKKFKCVAPMNICRLANDGEYAPGSILCDEPLRKIGNVCSSGEVPYYTGLLGQIIVNQKPGGTRCEFQLDPTGTDGAGKPLTTDHIEGAINLAIKTTRSMEWLYSTVSNDRNKDCLFTRNYLKDKMVTLIETRKDILKEYNIDIHEVEDNFKVLAVAKLEDQTVVTTLCAHVGGGYEVTTMHDVASRKATGLDFLCYMKERNAVHQMYEISMNRWVADLHKHITAYRDTVFSWGEKDKSWTTGDANHGWSDRECRDWPKWHKKVKRRWTERYKVFGRRDKNKEAVNKPGVTQYLSFMGDANSHEEFKKNYYLLDPLMPGGEGKGVSFGNYGHRRNFNGDDDRALGMGFSTVVSGVVTLGVATIGTGNDSGGLIDMYKEYDARLIEYLKSLRKDLPPENFIHEPEIRGSYEMRGCMDNMGRPECDRFKKYIGTLKDFAFAQFLAYSKHEKKKYKNYFSKDIWRKKLFNRYDSDLANLQNYYNALSNPTIGLRTKQEKCLDSLITQLNSSEYTNTEPAGINTGASNYYNQTESKYLGGGGRADNYNKYLGDGGRADNYNKGNIKKKYVTSKSFKLRAMTNSFMDKSGMKDRMHGKNAAGPSGIDGATISNGALASRMKAMTDANAKAVAKGVDLAAKEKDLFANMKNAGLMTGAGGASAMGGNSGGAASSGSTGTKATLDAEDTGEGKDANANLGKGIPSGATDGGGQNAGAGAGMAATGSGSGNDSGAGIDAGAAGGDGSGMSDEDKDRMAANYDRTKGEYKPNEDDSLFQVLSKTYVRNLDKILTRKKKLDEDAASFPSKPSTP